MVTPTPPPPGEKKNRTSCIVIRCVDIAGQFGTIGIGQYHLGESGVREGESVGLYSERDIGRCDGGVTVLLPRSTPLRGNRVRRGGTRLCLSTECLWCVNAFHAQD